MNKPIIESNDWNRKHRRLQGKRFGIKFTGIQDSSKPTLQEYYIPMKRKSRAGVEYTYYKKVIDKVGLGKNDKKVQDRTPSSGGQGVPEEKERNQ